MPSFRPAPVRVIWVLISACVVGVAACAPVLPQEPVERALVRDMARVVDVKATTGWLIDETEIDFVLADAMKSACQVPERNRRQALAWLDRQIQLDGGDVAASWRQKGRDLGEVGTLLLWTRTRLLLARADEWARLGRCPFWLEPSYEFRGVHIQGSRFVLSLEGGGRFVMATPDKKVMMPNSVQLGAGGSGRLLGGWAFSDSWAMLIGAEFGGDARFSELQIGEAQSLPSLAAFAAIPVVGRWDFGLSTYAELEAGPLVLIDSAQVVDPLRGTVAASSRIGLRTGLAFGGSFLRAQQGVIPKFALAIIFEAVPSIEFYQVGFGLRTGLDFSFWRRF